VKVTVSAILAAESLALVILLGLYFTGHREQCVNLIRADAATPSQRLGVVPQGSMGLLAPRAADQKATYTSTLLVDLESPERVPTRGQMFDACGIQKASSAVTCVKNLILLDMRCAMRTPSECEAHVALPREAEMDFEAVVAGGLRAHLFSPRS
jgi:hypothetical protein